MLNIVCVIPTLNAEETIFQQLSLLKKQNVDILLIDSSSDDNTIKIAKKLDVESIIIDRKDFDHGGTRTLATKYKKSDIVIFFTQDALPYDKNTIAEIINPFEVDKEIAAVYGRQIPYPNESIFGRHLRLFNYGERSYCRVYSDKERFGIKTAFLSDSFAAYRTSMLKDIGYFKNGLILGEDMYAGAMFLKKGKKIFYCAEAKVYHSHSYSILQEFKRYFDIGVFHKSESWILEEFGKPEGEGLKYIKSEWKFILKEKKVYLLINSFIRILVKYIGYKLGTKFRLLPNSINRYFSMLPKWFSNE